MKNVSNKAITYQDHFKEHCINEVNKGKLPRAIFEEIGRDFPTKEIKIPAKDHLKAVFL